MVTVMHQMGFDYESLAPEVRTDVRDRTQRIHELERRTAISLIEMGEHLIAVQEKIGRYQFQGWLKAEFQWSQPTASRMMSVAREFAGRNIQIEYFAPSALYALTTGDVPEEIIEGFVQVAESGRKVTHSDVKEAIQEYRQPAPQPEPRNVVEVDADTGEILEDDEPTPAMPLSSPQFTPTSAPAPAPAPAPQKHVHVAQNSGENEWYTPAEYIEAAREVMGSIDLDPASSDIANERVKAAKYFTKETNGLAKEWHGNVWMNPPYAQPLMNNFADKVVEEYDAGRIDSAIVLVNNATETKWFQSMMTAATAVCFPTGRIRYLTPSGQPANTPLQGQAFLYFGGDDNGFARVFSRFGFVLGVL